MLYKPPIAQYKTTSHFSFIPEHLNLWYFGLNKSVSAIYAKVADTRSHYKHTSLPIFKYALFCSQISDLFSLPTYLAVRRKK